jgi:dephospho-CoA kinase
MIIGINGKIGSGKDTVGNIIQYLTAEDTGQFCLGRIQSGKSIEGHHNSTFEIKKFAGKLKTIASLLTGIPVEKFEDQEFKQKHMGLQWKMTYREFLQKLGTEAMRDGLHTNVWVNALFADYKAVVKEWDELGNDTLVEYPNWILTDTRFPNELEAVEERRGITIRVVRDIESKDDSVIAYSLALTAKAMRDKTGPFHPSETALDDAKFDYEIINDGSIEDLVEKVKKILIKENII